MNTTYTKNHVARGAAAIPGTPLNLNTRITPGKSRAGTAIEQTARLALALMLALLFVSRVTAQN